MNAPVPHIQVGTHSVAQAYLYAFAARHEVMTYIRTRCIEDEVKRLDEILQSWQHLQARVATLQMSEAGLPDSAVVSPLPDEIVDEAEALTQAPMFRRTFSALGTTVGIVEIDKLVAPQRAVNIEYAEKIKASVTDMSDASRLLQLCVSAERDLEPIQHLEIAPNNHVFTSPNTDMRFLGAYVKERPHKR